MSSTGKRLDLRFGAFACSVQGFDDPVEPVQQILRAIQHLLEESPELSDTAISFDAEAIEQLVGEVARRAELDEREVEIVPGLVIIHHGAGGDLTLEAEGDAARQSDWSVAFGAAPAEPGAADRDAAWQADTPAESRDGASGQRADEATVEGYVNLFAGDGEAAEGSDADDPEGLVPRLRRVSEAQDAEYGWDDAEDGRHKDIPRDHAPEPEERAADPVNLFAAEDDAAAGAEDPAPGRNLFAVVDNEAGDNEAEDETDWRLMLTHVGSGAAERAAGTGEHPREDRGGEPGAEAEASYTPAGLAERAGARTVPELMVAAAAWMVLMKGQTRFTRRDVLDVFDTIPGEHEKTPEARIKGFGKAVRNGHLAMIEEGVFGISPGDLERYQALL